jgi:hypothetical protein
LDEFDHGVAPKSSLPRALSASRHRSGSLSGTSAKKGPRRAA